MITLEICVGLLAVTPSITVPAPGCFPCLHPLSHHHCGAPPTGPGAGGRLDGAEPGCLHQLSHHHCDPPTGPGALDGAESIAVSLFDDISVEFDKC